MDNLTYGDLKKMVLEALDEENVSGAVGGFNSPKAFKRNAGKFFMRKVFRPKRPSHTKMFDFLEEKYE